MGIFSNNDEKLTYENNVLDDSWWDLCAECKQAKKELLSWYDDFLKSYNNHKTIINRINSAPFGHWYTIYIYEQLLYQISFADNRMNQWINCCNGNINWLSDLISRNRNTLTETQFDAAKSGSWFGKPFWGVRSKIRNSTYEMYDAMEIFQDFNKSASFVKKNLNIIINEINPCISFSRRRYPELTGKQYEEDDFIDQYNQMYGK